MTRPVTVYGRPKPFSWSYSKLKNFKSCPKRYWHIDVQKDVVEEESEHLAYGNAAHKALAEALGKDKPLPEPFKDLTHWVTRMRETPGRLLVEQKYAINSQFGPTEYFARDAWYRGVGDVVAIHGPVALVADWKTGKILEDSVQLALMAQCLFAHYPELQAVRSEFVWLKHDATTRQDFRREGMAEVWARLLPEVRELEQAHATTNFPPRPGHLCRKWCPVRQCPNWGE